MPSKRTGFAPWSLTREAGVQSATVEGTIEVPQNVQPVLSTGFVDYKGNWKGTKSSDEQFFGFTKHVLVADGGTTLSPDTGNRNFIDMTGFKNLWIAVKPSNGGNYAISAVMGPDTNSFANLNPIIPASNLRALTMNRSTDRLDSLFSDPADSLTSDAWNIFWVESVLQDQKNMQIKIVNDTGGESTIDVAFLRTI